MNCVRKTVEFFVNVVLYPVSYRQMGSILLLLAVMMPITVPVPVWAYSRNLSELMPNENPTLFGSASDPVSEAFDFFASLNDDKDSSKDKKKNSDSKQEAENVKNIPNGKDPEKDVDSLEFDQSANVKVSEDKQEKLENADEPRTESEKEEALLPATAPIAIVNQLPADERESLYSPQNNLGAPAGQTEADSSNRAAAIPIRHRVGARNFSFGVPLASLSGRGLDAGVGLTYNSRTWNKSCETYDPQLPEVCTQYHYTYDVQESWIAPGFSTGYGYLASNFKTRTISVPTGGGGNYENRTLTEIIPEGIFSPDGTGQQIVCMQETQIPGAHPAYSYCSAYRTGDGSFIKVERSGGSNYSVGGTVNYGNTSFTVTNTDGSKVYYGTPFGSGNNRKHYPLIIQDRNGNRVRIAYKSDYSGRIDYITDTLNRKIKFYYENNTSGNPDKLVAVTIPGMGADEEIQTVRFYYEDMTLDTAGKFTGTITGPANSTVRTLRWVYMPATKTAFKYTYHSSYGMIKKIERRVGVTASGTSTTATGSISSEGTWAATTEYDFPDGSAALTDVPKYSKRSDDWFGRTGAVQETLYDIPEPSGDETVSKITVKNAAFEPGTNGTVYADVVTENVSRADGMLKETLTKKVYGPDGQYNYLMSKVKYFWNDNRLLTKIEVTNDSGLTKATEFDYDGFFNQTDIREYGYAVPGSVGTLLRTTEIDYQTGTGWINANLLGLPTLVKTTVGGTVVSKALMEYDHNGNDTTLGELDGIDETGTHSTYYNPSHPPTSEEVCPLASSGDNCITIYHPGYGAGSAYRGNVTKTTRFSDATLATDSNADVDNYNYDIAGNVISATLSCCQLKTIEYGSTFAETGYAFPTKETKGSSTPQLVTEYTFNRNTGLLRFSKDENQQQTEYEYESETLRPKKTIFPNGGYVENSYSDTTPGETVLLPGYLKQKTTLETNKFAESYSYFDARGIGTRTATQTPDGWSVSAVELDNLGRAIKAYNPFYAATASGSIPATTKFVETTAIDSLGRATRVKMQDDTVATTYFSLNSEIPTDFNKTFVVMTDQAGKQRRQVFDSLGRIVRVDEPDSTGALPDLENPAVSQKTSYEYDGNDNLIKVIQSDGTITQERKFKYDSLSRLVAEKQVEASPTLTEAGVHGAPDPNKWTKVLSYNVDGLLHQGIDARGVTTTFDYDTLNRIEEVVYSDGTPKVRYYYDQARTGFHNKGALTKVETIRETNTPAAIFATSAEFDYDQMGRLRKHRQWIDAQQYDLEYEYNLAGQMTSQKYPSGKVVTTGYDANGRLSSVADPARTYLSGAQYQGKGNSLSQMSLGNGTVENYVLNDRLQLDLQELKKGSDVLQKFDYGYGQIDPTTGNLDTTKNNGQLSVIESYIGPSKQATQKFKYDHIGRLKESAEYRGDNNNLTYRQKFDFDRFGNLYRKAANNSTSGQGNPLAYTAIEEGTTSGTGDIEKTTNRFRTNTTYDDAGNVTTDSKFRSMSFAYDANGRQIKASRASVLDAWTVYDAGGNRVATKINNIWQYMVYDAMGKLVAEYGNVADGLGGVKYVQQDWQGSVRTVTNNNGFVVSRADHQAFGGNVGYGTGQRSIEQGYNSDPATRQGYGLTERDEASGLDHTWFRKNENAAGRWTSPDPYKGSMNLGDPQSFNRYSYVQNDPVNWVDPAGLNPASPGTTYSSGILWSLWYGNNHDGWKLVHQWFEAYPGSGQSNGSGEGGASSQQVQNPKATVRDKLANFLKFKAKQCADALKALGLTDGSILRGFDNNKFNPGGPSSNDAKTNWYPNGTSDTTTQNGVIDFINQPMGFLIHEVGVHAVRRLTDSQAYNRLLRAQRAGNISGLAVLATVTNGQNGTASPAISGYLNSACKDTIQDSPLPSDGNNQGSTSA